MIRVGIDLGTSHSALSYIDPDLSEGEDLAHHVLKIPQCVAPGECAPRDLLPSNVYLPSEHELSAGAGALPWNSTPANLVGEVARGLGAKSATRLVSSAKSWLCHPGVDRRKPLLPLDAPEDVVRVSPLKASQLYLEHLREAFEHANPGEKLADQNVVITVPASFDPAARDLTSEAAEAAGIGGATLLEEPLAALYAWIAQSRGGWREAVEAGDIVLVVDVGGGTTDLSLVAVEEEDGELRLERIAVGQHILLGGDNMDLALAYFVAQRIEAEQGKALDDWQMRACTHACRSAKERLLSGELEEVPVVVPSRGSRLIGKTLKTTLKREEVQNFLLEGFFPAVNASERPASRERSGLTEMGLPYAQDAAITRHLAAFLARQKDALAGREGFVQNEGSFLHPTAVLFNGGVFKAAPIAERIIDVLTDWLMEEDADPVRVLEGEDLDRAVAQGAAYYAHIRESGGVRVRAGLGQSYYVGVESSMPAIPGLAPPIRALCVAPFGLEEGDNAPSPEQGLGLVVGESVRFRFFGSSVRRDDVPGDVLTRWTEEELTELGQIEATLPGDEKTVVPVRLEAHITSLGALVLEAIASQGDERWRVEMSVREPS